MLCLALILFSCISDSIEDDNFTEPSQFLNPCVNDDPITRVVNNGTVAFDLKVLDSNGVVLVDIANIPPSTTTSWASFAEGEVLFSLDSNQTLVNDDKVVLQMNTCMAFDIEIDANNEIVSYTPTTL